MNPKPKKLTIALMLISCSSLLSHPAFAGSELKELLRVLRDNGTITQPQYERLIREIDDAESQRKVEIEEKVREEVKQVAEPKLKSKYGGLSYKSVDGNFEFNAGGRIQADYAYYDSDETRLGSGTEFRRFRFFMSGKAFRDWGYKAQVDFAAGDADIKDGYIQYLGWRPVKFTVGQHKEPFSLEELTSSKYITFMERALPNTFVSGRSLGLSAYTHGDQWSLQGGVFGEEFDSDADNEGDEGYAFAARATYAPIAEKARVIHLGLGGFHRETSDDNEVRFRSRPESHVTGERLVDTGTFAGDDYDTYGIEVAGLYGPFSLQGEYIRNDVNRKNASDVDFDGWYAYGSWFITGESRNYDPRKGTFGRIKPKSIVGQGGYGAWELAARYSKIDLDDKDISGGEMKNITIGLNWYPTPNTRLMANYIKVDTDTNKNDENDGPNVFQIRAQYDL